MDNNRRYKNKLHIPSKMTGFIDLQKSFCNESLGCASCHECLYDRRNLNDFREWLKESLKFDENERKDT